MSFKRFLPIILLAAAFLASCVDNHKSMGEDLVTDDFKLKIRIKKFDLPVTNRVSDSLQAFNNRYAVVGYMNYPEYGLKKSSSVMNVLPYSDSTDFGTDPQFKSAYILLRIDSTMLYDENQKGLRQSMSLYRMNRVIDTTANYSGILPDSDYNPVPISQSKAIVGGNGITRIYLTEAYGKELLKMTPEDFKDLNRFVEKMKGIYIKVDDPLPGQTGGRFNYIGLTSNSSLHLNYILNDPERGFKDKDTTEVFALGYGKAFNYFSTGSEHLETEHPGNTLLVEGLDGVKPHIDAYRLKEMLENWKAEEKIQDKTIIISRALLTFPYETPENYAHFNNEHPRIIYAFRNVLEESDSIRYYKPLEDIYVTATKSMINRSNMIYELDVTSYCQDMILKDGKETGRSDDLWIAPMLTSSDSYNNMHFYIDNCGYSILKLNGPEAERKPTLTITYTVMEY